MCPKYVNNNLEYHIFKPILYCLQGKLGKGFILGCLKAAEHQLMLITSEAWLLSRSLLRLCPWESGVHDKTKEDESDGGERGVRVAADLVWTVVSSAVEPSLPAANLGGRQRQTGRLLLFSSRRREAK